MRRSDEQSAEQQSKTNQDALEELRRQYSQQQAASTKQMNELIERCYRVQEVTNRHKEEMKHQAEAYEQQANGLRQQVELVNQREKQRVASIKARVHLSEQSDSQMAHAQNDLRTLTQTFRISSPVRADVRHDTQVAGRQPASPLAAQGNYERYVAPTRPNTPFNL